MIVSFVLSDAEIHNWYKSLRTKYGKLKKKKSRDGQVEHTDGKKWVL